MATMEYAEIPGLPMPVSRVVQGITSVNVQDDAIGFGHLDAAWESGINCVDTARVYGPCDAFVGRWMASRGNREKVLLLGKGAHHNSERRRVTPFDIAEDLNASLEALQTDYIDLYVLHRDDPDQPVESIVDALNRHVQEGKMRAFGGSNWSTARLQEANDYAKASGQTPFAVSSPNFSLARQLQAPWAECVTISGPDNEGERQWYAKTNMPLFTWSSLAGGFLTGRYQRDNVAPPAEGLSKLIVDCYAAEDNFQRVDRLRELGASRGLTPAQMALAYVMNYPLNIHALVAAANREELQANLEAFATRLTPQELAYLDLRADSPT